VNASDRASIDELVERWAHAERGNDAAGLEPLLAADFSAVGPAGFVLDRAGWLGRYRSGDLVNDAFEWETASVRTYDGCAVVVGLQRHDTRYRGQPNPGEFRATLVAVPEDGGWRLAALHLSPIGWRPPRRPDGDQVPNTDSAA
jgi:ketosteroid isomerase-like protein